MVKENIGRNIYMTIVIIVLILLLYYTREANGLADTYNFYKDMYISYPDLFWYSISSIIFLLGIVSIMVLLYLKKKHIFNKIIESFKIIWLEIWAPFTVFIIMFLGWLHANYPYESYFKENVTQSFSTFGNITMTIYNYGTQFPGWGWALIWIGMFGFGLWNVIDVWRTPNKEESKDSLNKPKGLNTTKNLGEQHEKEEIKIS